MSNRRYHIEAGRRFGALVVVSDADSKGALCRCDCGKERIVGRGFLLHGEQTSCGCRVSFKGRVPGNKSHGMRNSREYTSWNQMVQRCTNPDLESYKRYGARGVSVAGEWVGPGGFDRFFAHIGPRPTPQHSVDRFPRASGNYEPGNVRWATKREQAVNRRTTRLITFDGRTQCAADWGRALGVSGKTIVNRVARGIPLDAPKRGAA